MARSQEALLRRAEKRSVPVEVQRLKDKKRTKSSSGVTSDSVSSGDWQCEGCSYSNYASRSECKKCKKSRDGGNVSTDGIKPLKTATKPDTTTTTTSTNWICHKCKNNNFANRADCNRCGEPRTAVEVAPSSGSQPKVPTVKTEPVPVSSQKPKQQQILVSNNVVKHKKYEWGKQASAEKIEENKLLLEIIKSAEANSDNGSTLLQQLSPEEVERAKVLLARKKRKQDKKVKMAKMKTILAKKQQAAGGKGGGGGGASKGSAAMKSAAKTVTKPTAATTVTTK